MVSVVYCLVGCASHLEHPTIGSARYIHLGVPLSSEEGQVKLAILKYLSEEILKESPTPRFVPLSDAEIKEIHGGWPRDIRSASRLEFSTRRGVIDKVTKEEGTLLAVAGVRIDGGRALGGGGYNRNASVWFAFHLVKENQHWTVREATLDRIE